MSCRIDPIRHGRGTGLVDADLRLFAGRGAVCSRSVHHITVVPVIVIIVVAALEDRLYAFGAEVESNTIEVYISRLRKKPGRARIETVRGMGYRLARS